MKHSQILEVPSSFTKISSQVDEKGSKQEEEERPQGVLDVRGTK